MLRAMSSTTNRRATKPAPRAARKPSRADPRRAIPSLDALLRSPAGARASAQFGRPVLKQAVAITLAEVRVATERGARSGAPVPDPVQILAPAGQRAAHDMYGLDEVINATGVLLHTGLGRAPLAPAAAKAAARASTGYADLEVDRETGRRGRRTARAERLLCALTGAEDALAVNNNAAAILLMLAALARRKEVLVSRGELI